MMYITQFQGHFKGLCNRNLRKIVLNSVIIKGNSNPVGLNVCYSTSIPHVPKS